MQSIIVLYIKETDGRPADGAVPHRMRGNGRCPRNTICFESKNVIEERQNMRMLVEKMWFLMSEINRGPGYHIYHRMYLHIKKTKRVGQMDDFRIQN